MWLTKEEQWALTLSTFAGLSTTIGAAFAVIKRPDDALLAFLLGTAIGVMFLLSFLEMWLRNALHNGWGEVTFSVLCGALLYRFIQPFLPEMHADADADGGSSAPDAAAPLTGGGRGKGKGAGGSGGDGEGVAKAPSALAERSASGKLAAAAERKAAGGGSSSSSNGGGGSGKPPKKQAGSTRRSGELLRLGLLMAMTMTLHNLPEGFAVAFAAFTDFGPIMAAAIAVHNIPEGVIVAAPVYAATGSRWKALAIATASGLSEPVGALLALLFVKPFLTEATLHYILAFVGGIMMAVCVLELWPEARKCRSDRRLVAGVALGGAVMGWTLYVGV